MARIPVIIHITTANGAYKYCHRQCAHKVEHDPREFYCLAFSMVMPVLPEGSTLRHDKCLSAQKKYEKLIKKQGEF